jgi:tetratricopeptide (TPR) repeat protein
MNRRTIFIGLLILLTCFVQTRGVRADDSMTLSLPGKTWALKFNMKNFEIQLHDFLPNQQGEKLQAKNNKNGLVMSVFVTPAKAKISAGEYRDLIYQDMIKKPPLKSGLKTYDKKSMAFTEYTIKKLKDARGMGREFDDFIEKAGGDADFNQRNVFVYLVKGDMWIDFHLSKVFYSNADAEIFDDFIQSIQIIDPHEPTSMDFFKFGSYFYRENNYKEAIKYYQKALDREKSKQELSNDYWLVLVDNLGMSYGISGDFANAKSTFEYGLSKRPTYPMFYYNLACNYAEQNDLDNSLKNLRMAFKYKDNMIKGEVLPNPAQDASFKKFLNEKRFLDLLKSLNQ